MKIAPIQDWVQLERIECPRQFPGTGLHMPEELCQPMEDRAVGALIAAGPDVPAEIREKVGKRLGLDGKTGLWIAYNETRSREIPGRDRDNYVCVRWADCIGPVVEDPWPTAEQLKKDDERSKKAGQEWDEKKRAFRAKQELELAADGARRLVNASGSPVAVE